QLEVDLRAAPAAHVEHLAEDLNPRDLAHPPLQELCICTNGVGPLEVDALDALGPRLLAHESRPPTNCASPLIRWRTSLKPRSSSAPVISSRSNIRCPERAPSRPSTVRSAGVRSLQLVRIAIRPPGVSTRVM